MMFPSNFATPWLPLASIPFLVLVCGCHSPSVSFTQADGQLRLYDAGQLRFVYQISPLAAGGPARAHYLHPLMGLEGELLSEDFPEDHPHHRGIFWAWHQLHVEGRRVADPWLCEGLAWKVSAVKADVDQGVGRFESVVDWVVRDSASGDSISVVREVLKGAYQRGDAAHYVLDLSTSLQALLPQVEIGGSEDDKGYGGFSLRLVTPPDFRIEGEREVAPQNGPVDAGRWVDFSGTFGPDEASGLMVMCEPEALPAFQGWILRQAGSMQNVAFPGSGTLLLSQDEPLVIRNRLVVYRHRPEQALIEALYRAWQQERP